MSPTSCAIGCRAGRAAEDDLASRSRCTSSLAAALIVAPRRLARSTHDAPPTLMTISLGGGSAGPENGGMTAIGGRPVQAVTPPEEPPSAKRSAPPAAKTPEMTVPLPNATTGEDDAAAERSSRRPTRRAAGRRPGAQEHGVGSAIADTGVARPGLRPVDRRRRRLRVVARGRRHFCCPDYLATMIARIRAAWNQNQGAARHQPDREVHDSARRHDQRRDDRASRAAIATLDIAALRAVLATRSCRRCPTPFRIRR